MSNERIVNLLKHLDDMVRMSWPETMSQHYADTYTHKLIVEAIAELEAREKEAAKH